MDNLTQFQRSLELDRIYRKGELSASAAPATRRTIRVATWNIARGHRPERIVEALRRLNPDVVCLQEVDWGNARTRSIDVLEYIAERTAMLGLFGIEFLELNAPGRRRRLSGGGAIGNAILTRFEPRSEFRVPLPAFVDWDGGANNPALTPFERWRLGREPRIGKRFGIGIDFIVGQRTFVVCSLHLEDKHGGVEGRWSQYLAAAKVIESRSRESDIRLIAGDFNTFDSWRARFFTSDTDAMALGKPGAKPEAEWWKNRLLPAIGYRDPFEPTDWTFAVEPFFRAKLDWITLREAQVMDHGIGPFATADHRPLWLDIDLDAQLARPCRKDEDGERPNPVRAG